MVTNSSSQFFATPGENYTIHGLAPSGMSNSGKKSFHKYNVHMQSSMDNPLISRNMPEQALYAGRSTTATVTSQPKSAVKNHSNVDLKFDPYADPKIYGSPSPSRKAKLVPQTNKI
jgi:hypothetical protein